MDKKEYDKKYNKEYHEINKEKIKERKKIWYQKNNTKILLFNKKNRIFEYIININ
jgi:hypothetical protein